MEFYNNSSAYSLQNYKIETSEKIRINLVSATLDFRRRRYYTVCLSYSAQFMGNRIGLCRCTASHTTGEHNKDELVRLQENLFLKVLSNFSYLYTLHILHTENPNIVLGSR